MLAAGLGLAALPTSADLLSISSRDIETTAIVLPGDIVRSGRLPGPLHERDLGPIFSGPTMLACLPLASRPGARLVLFPGSGNCQPFESLSRGVRAQLARSIAALPEETVDTTIVLIRPAPAGSPLTCACPPPDDEPEVIIRNGFEASP
jgi:hypothetical protein